MLQWDDGKGAYSEVFKMNLSHLTPNTLGSALSPLSINQILVFGKFATLEVRCLSDGDIAW